MFALLLFNLLYSVSGGDSVVTMWLYYLAIEE